MRTTRNAVLLLLIGACAESTPAKIASPPSTATVAPSLPSTPSSSTNSVAAAGYPTQAPTWPRPPEQNAPWQPKAGAPEALVDVARTLFKQGLGDPRGCEYREIEIFSASVWGNGDIYKTRGWVLPGSSGYAVLWDGSIDRVKAAHGKADLRADVDQALKTVTNPARGNVQSEVMFTPLSPLLLLRLGENDLAAKVWDSQKNAVHTDGRGAETYYWLAENWIWTLYDRAVNMHMQGGAHDETALESVRLLHLYAPQVEEELARRGRKKEPKFDEKGRMEKQSSNADPYITFLKNLPELERDQERRADSRATKGAPASEKLAAVDPKLPIQERVAQYIARLDEVQARQWGQPGGVDLGSEPAVQGLVQIGAPAVPALLDTIERDDRLTRSVHFWRDFSHHRSVLGVHEAAYAAFAQIVETSFFHPASTGDDLSGRGVEGRKALVKELRAYWEKWKNTTKEEKWFALLMDDRAKPEDWVRSAGLLAQDLNTTGGPMARSSSRGAYRPASAAQYNQRPCRGDSLRTTKTNPSVSDLIEMRIESLGNAGPDKRAYACELALYFAEWDPARAKASLAKEVERARKPKSDNDGGQTSARCIAAMTLERAHAVKDPNALKEYAAFMMNELTGSALSSSPSNQFAPMSDFPNDPDIKKAAEKMFGAGSRFLPFVADKDTPDNERSTRRALEELLREENGGLLKIPAFKAHVIATLSTNKKKLGDATYKGDGAVHTNFLDGGQSVETNTPTLRPPPQGTKFIVRVNDVYAKNLARHPHAPPYQPYWPEPERDAAIAALIGWVRAQ